MRHILICANLFILYNSIFFATQRSKEAVRQKENAEAQINLYDYDIIEDGQIIPFQSRALQKPLKKHLKKRENLPPRFVAGNGRLVHKKLGQPDQVISKLEERKGDIGTKIWLYVELGG